MAKGQTSAVMMVMALLVFVGMIIILLTLAGSLSKVEYENTFAHNKIV